MEKDRLSELKEMLRRDHIFDTLDRYDVNIPQNAKDFKINSAGAGGNKTELINYNVEGLEKEGETTWHSKKVPFKVARKLETLGVPKGINRG